jgi:hypothetical protein
MAFFSPTIRSTGAEQSGARERATMITMVDYGNLREWKIRKSRF